MIITCKWCGNDFKNFPSNNRVYCSKECYRKSLIKDVYGVCKRCNKKFLLNKSFSLEQKSKAKYCSIKCAGFDRRYKVEHYCECCGKTFYRCKSVDDARFCSIKCRSMVLNKKLDGANTWKGGRRINAAGYMTLYRPEHPENNYGYVLEHRIVMEEHLGRTLGKNEVVHHKNKNKTDNRIENLQIMSPAEHQRLHNIERWIRVRGIQH